METGEAPGEPVMRIQCPQRKVTRGGLLPYPEINDARYDQVSFPASALPRARTRWMAEGLEGNALGLR